MCFTFFLLPIGLLRAYSSGLGVWTTPLVSNRKHWVKTSCKRENVPYCQIQSYNRHICYVRSFYHFWWGNPAYLDQIQLPFEDVHTHVHTRRLRFDDEIIGADYSTGQCCSYTRCCYTSRRQYISIHNLEQFCRNFFEKCNRVFFGMWPQKCTKNTKNTNISIFSCSG